MQDQAQPCDVLTVTLNPAIDQTVTVRNFTAGIVNRVERTHSNPGGKGVNVASALADYGRSVSVTGFLGRDNDGPFTELFARKSISDAFVRVAGETRTGIKIADPVQKKTTDINFPGAAPTSDDIAALKSFIRTVKATWCVLAGSIPPGVEPTIYRDLVDDLKAHGCRVLVDTSGCPLQQAVEALPDVIKPNIHELGELLGRSLESAEEVVQAARSLVEKGIRLVVVSMGEEGACLVDAHNTVIARPPAIEVRSTVGAGDAMVAGILAAQLEGLSLTDCARLATAFSLDVLSRAEPGLTSVAAVKDLMNQVDCRQLEPPAQRH